MRKVDLNDWEKCGAGEFGALYCNRGDRNLLLKLPVSGIDPELIRKEIARSVKVYEAGLPVPEPGELVTDGERKMEELAPYIALRIWSVETEINVRTPDECTREPFKVFDSI